MFTAVQAAQKSAMTYLECRHQFTAVQAAQKSPMFSARFGYQFTAVQAAQKLWIDQYWSDGVVHCRTGSLRKTTRGNALLEGFREGFGEELC